jgi:hypothetical protein
MSPDHLDRCTNPGKVPWYKWKDLQERLPTEDEVRNWWRRHPDANLGLALGYVSGLVRVDVDGPAGEAELQRLSGGDLPATLELTGGRPDSRGLLYRIPDGTKVKTTAKPLSVGEELRLQAHGAQTVLPPSRHASGRLYAWRPGHGPGEIKPALAPAWLLSALDPERRTAGTSTAIWRQRCTAGDNVEKRAIAWLKTLPAAVSGQGGHNQTMAAARGVVYGFDLGPERGFDILAVHYNPRCRPPWTEAELRHKCEDADTVPFDKPRGYLRDANRDDWRPRPSLNGDGHEETPAEEVDAKLTDCGNAIRFRQLHGDDVRHCFPWKKWLVWDGCRWRPDTTGEATRRAKRVVVSIFDEAQARVQEIQRQLKAEAEQA